MARPSFHDFAEEYPLADEQTIAIIAADMKSRGYDERFPIVLFDSKIIDGRNRSIASERAGILPTYTVFDGSEDDAKAFVFRANENRRHLTVAWLKKRREERIERVVVARTEGQSLRTIAESEGVSDAQVRRDLETAGATGVAPEPQNGKVTGSDGKQYDAEPDRPEPLVCPRCARDKRIGNVPPKSCKDCKKLREDAKPKTAAEPKPSTIVEPRKDKAGVVVHQRTIQAFDLAESIGDICRRLDGIAREIEAAAKDAGGRMIHASVVQSIRSARKTLYAARATHVCPYCKGEGECDGCKNEGWLTATYYDQAPAELRKAGADAVS